MGSEGEEAALAASAAVMREGEVEADTFGCGTSSGAVVCEFSTAAVLGAALAVIDAMGDVTAAAGAAD